MELTGMFFLLIHIVLCCLTYLCIRLGLLRVKKHMMPVVIFVPVWGLICCLILHFQIFFGADNRKIPGIEKLRINEEFYRSILPEHTETQKDIIPMEEALLVNAPKVRRNLIMDILNDHPEAYLNVLQQARMNEDVEVVHYATTAMSELSKGYDIQFQQREHAWREHPDSPEELDAFCAFLKEYLSQGMADGQLELVYRERYSQLLRQKADAKPSLRTYCEMVKNEMLLERFDSARSMLDEMKLRWQMEETYQMLRLEYYARLGQGDALHRQIREMEEQKIYLSRKNRERLQFWRKQADEKMESENGLGGFQL